MIYHITPDGPKTCTATVGSCKYGKKNGKHYESQAEAFVDYEKQLVDKYGTLGQEIATKVNNKPIQKYYRKRDKIESSNPIAKKWANHRALRNGALSGSNNKKSQKTGMLPSSNLRHKSILASRAKKILSRQGRKFSKSLSPNSRQVKKLMMVKYWMPDPHSNKWKE